MAEYTTTTTITSVVSYLTLVLVLAVCQTSAETEVCTSFLLGDSGVEGTDSPFNILIVRDTDKHVQGGEHIQVELKGDQPIAGFALGAVASENDGSDVFVGHFKSTQLTADGKEQTTLMCDRTVLTHADAGWDPNNKVVEAYWIAPNHTFTGSIRFKATIVSNSQTYWVNGDDGSSHLAVARELPASSVFPLQEENSPLDGELFSTPPTTSSTGSTASTQSTTPGSGSLDNLGTGSTASSSTSSSTTTPSPSNFSANGLLPEGSDVTTSSSSSSSTTAASNSSIALIPRQDGNVEPSPSTSSSSSSTTTSSTNSSAVTVDSSEREVNLETAPPVTSSSSSSTTTASSTNSSSYTSANEEGEYTSSTSSSSSTTSSTNSSKTFSPSEGEAELRTTTPVISSSSSSATTTNSNYSTSPDHTNSSSSSSFAATTQSQRGLAALENDEESNSTTYFTVPSDVPTASSTSSPDPSAPTPSSTSSTFISATGPPASRVEAPESHIAYDGINFRNPLLEEHNSTEAEFSSQPQAESSVNVSTADSNSVNTSVYEPTSFEHVQPTANSQEVTELHTESSTVTEITTPNRTSDPVVEGEAECRATDIGCLKRVVVSGIHQLIMSLEKIRNAISPVGSSSSSADEINY